MIETIITKFNNENWSQVYPLYEFQQIVKLRFTLFFFSHIKYKAVWSNRSTSYELYFHWSFATRSVANIHMLASPQGYRHIITLLAFCLD